MAHSSGQNIEDVATEGPGLVFDVYPAAISQMPGSTYWVCTSVLFARNLNERKLSSQIGFDIFYDAVDPRFGQLVWRIGGDHNGAK